MYCEKCGTKLNEQGVCLKCNGLQEKGSKLPRKMILLVTLVGLMISALCGLFVWNLTEKEIYHEFSEKSDFKVFYGIDGYNTIEHNMDATNCIILLGIVITVAIDVFIYIKNRNK